MPLNATCAALDLTSNSVRFDIQPNAGGVAGELFLRNVPDVTIAAISLGHPIVIDFRDPEATDMPEQPAETTSPEPEPAPEPPPETTLSA